MFQLVSSMFDLIKITIIYTETFAVHQQFNSYTVFILLQNSRESYVCPTEFHQGTLFLDVKRQTSDHKAAFYSGNQFMQYFGTERRAYSQSRRRRTEKEKFSLCVHLYTYLTLSYHASRQFFHPSSQNVENIIGFKLEHELLIIFVVKIHSEVHKYMGN